MYIRRGLYVTKLKPEELRQAYEKVAKEYHMEDAAEQLNDAMQSETISPGIYSALMKRDMLEKIVEDYEYMEDNNRAPNDIWQSAIKEVAEAFRKDEEGMLHE